MPYLLRQCCRIVSACGLVHTLLVCFLLTLCPLSTVHCVKWTLVGNLDLYNNSYVMSSGWHPHRHSHWNDTCPISPEDGQHSGKQHIRPIRIVVLAPYQSNEEYSLHQIMPSIVAAVRGIEEEAKRTNGKKYQGGWEHGAQIDFVDTKCSSAIGPLAAFEYFIRGKVDVFLGPVCPYVLAPVARYTSYWDVPHLTSSGQVTMFDDKNTTFRILTRMNGSFSRMGQFFNQVNFLYNFKKKKIPSLIHFAHLIRID